MRSATIFGLAIIAAGWSLCAAAQTGPSVYIFDVLRRSNYPTAYNRMFKGETGVPTWFASAKAASRSTTTPGRVVRIGSREEELYTFCKQHECSGNDVAVLFSDSGDRAVAASDLNGSMRFYGNPDLAEQIELRRSLGDM